MRSCAATMLLGALLLQAGAAPAPPSRAVTAEAVVALGYANPQQVAKSLRSADVLSAIVRSQKGRQLACLTREKNPEVWLDARLKVFVDEKRQVTIRLVGCHKRDALPLLWAVVEGYKARVYRSDREMAAVMEMRQAQVLQGGRIAGGQQELAVVINDLEARMKDFVIQPPRLVPDGQ